MEILPNVHRFDAPLGRRTLAQHLLTGETLVVIDTGTAATPAEAILPYLRTLGRSAEDISLVVVTHPDSDHSGGLAALRKAAPRAVLACHVADQPLIESPRRCLQQRYDFKIPYGVRLPAEQRCRLEAALGEATAIDLTLEGVVRVHAGEESWEIRHAPGHSLGHVVLFHPGRRAVILTDAVLGKVIPDEKGRPFLLPTFRHFNAYLDTIDRILLWEPEMLLPSHFPPIIGREPAARFLLESREFAIDLDRRVAAFLRQAERPCTLGQTVTAVLPAIFPLGGSEPGAAAARYFASFPFAAVLDAAVERGSVQCSPGQGINRYTASP